MPHFLDRASSEKDDESGRWGRAEENKITIKSSILGCWHDFLLQLRLIRVPKCEYVWCWINQGNLQCHFQHLLPNFPPGIFNFLLKLKAFYAYIKSFSFARCILPFRQEIQTDRSVGLMCPTWYSFKSRMTLKHISFCFPPLTGLNIKHPELLSGYTNQCSIRFKPLHSHHYRPLGWNESASFFFSVRFLSFVSLYATRISCCGIEVSWLASSRCQVVTEWNSYVMRVFAAQRDWKQPKMVTLFLASLDTAARGHLGTKHSTISGVLKEAEIFSFWLTQNLSYSRNL